MLIALFAACGIDTTCETCPVGDVSTTPPVPAPTPTPPATTGDTAPAEDTVWTGPVLPTTLGTFVVCPGGDLGGEPQSSLEVVTATAESVTIAEVAPFEGCGCPVSLLAGLDEANRTVVLQWDAGDCGLITCCSGSATITGVPAGDWTIVDDGDVVTLQTSVSVP